MSAADNKQKIEAYFSRLTDKLREEVAPIVAETAVEYYKEAILSGKFDGVPFKPLSPRYQKAKKRNKDKTLYLNGLLFASIRPADVSPDKVIISAGSSKVPYARIHNEGGPVVARANVKAFSRYQNGKQVTVRPHARNINFIMPQRRFMGYSAELNELIKNRINGLIKGR